MFLCEKFVYLLFVSLTEYSNVFAVWPKIALRILNIPKIVISAHTAAVCWCWCRAKFYWIYQQYQSYTNTAFLLLHSNKRITQIGNTKLNEQQKEHNQMNITNLRNSFYISHKMRKNKKSNRSEWLNWIQLVYFVKYMIDALMIADLYLSRCAICLFFIHYSLEYIS